MKISRGRMSTPKPPLPQGKVDLIFFMLFQICRGFIESRFQFLEENVVIVFKVFIRSMPFERKTIKASLQCLSIQRLLNALSMFDRRSQAILGICRALFVAEL